MNKILIATLLLFSSLANASFEVVGSAGIDFGEITISTTKSIVFKNAGSVKASPAISLSGPDGSSFLISMNRCVNVSAGKNCQIYVISKKASGANRNLSANLNVGVSSFPISASINREEKISSFSFVSPHSEVLEFSPGQKSAIFPIEVINDGEAAGRPAVTVQNALVILDRCINRVIPNKKCQVYLQLRNNPLSLYTAKASLVGTNKEATVIVRGSANNDSLSYTALSFSDYSPAASSLAVCQGPAQSVRSITKCQRNLDQAEVDARLCSDPASEITIQSPAGSRSSTRLASGLGNLVESCQAGAVAWVPQSVSCDAGNHDNGSLECVPDDSTPPQNVTYLFANTYKANSFQYTKELNENLSITVPANDATSMIVSSDSNCAGTKVPFSSLVSISIDQSLDETKRYIQLFDAANNGTACQALSIKKDMAAPVISGVSLNKTVSSSATLTPTIQFSVSDLVSGLKQVKARVLTASGSQVTALQDIVSGTSLTASLTSGSYKIELQATDNVGNVATLSSASWIVDNVSPVENDTTVTFTNQTSNVDRTPEITVSSLDNSGGSGISLIELQLMRSSDNSIIKPWFTYAQANTIVTGLDLAAKTDYHLLVRSTDVAGNVATLGQTSKAYKFNIANARIKVVGSGRGYTDGSYAASCYAYKNPGATFEYAGSTGSGLYTIQIPGVSGTNLVYCDMDNDGGGWTRLYYQAAGGWFNMTTARSFDEGNPVNGNMGVTIARSYSIIGKMENLRRNGRLTFRLNFPQKTAKGIWSQTSNFSAAAGAVAGFSWINNSLANGFQGLSYNGNQALADGSNDGGYYWAVASTTGFSGGMPGNADVTYYTELWIQ